MSTETHEAPPEFIALVAGQQVVDLPKDLYIPPSAMSVFLEAFEGPLDLLLYLIKKQDVDILNIPVAEITRQYIQYIELMQHLELELAAEYLVMAAMLAEIKSRMLLPRPIKDDDEGNDPRAELVRRLQEYERYKEAAEAIDQLQREERDIFVAEASAPPMNLDVAQPDVQFEQLIKALKDVMTRAKMFESHTVAAEGLSVREKMTQILELAGTDQFTEFKALFTLEEGRMGVVVTFIAILELIKQSMLALAQSGAFAPIYVKRVG